MSTVADVLKQLYYMQMSDHILPYYRDCSIRVFSIMSVLLVNNKNNERTAHVLQFLQDIATEQ